MAAYKDLIVPHNDWPATVMSVDCTGSHVVLGARKGLAFISLNAPSIIIKKVNRNSKWECGPIEWNPHISDAHILASVSNQKTEIWKWRDGNAHQQQILRAHTRAISDLNWSWYDPELLSTCSVDQFVYIWDLRDSRKPATSLQAVVGASQVKWSREDRHVLATSHDGDIRVWDLRKGNTPAVYITAHLSKIHGIDWSRNSSTALATCSNDSTVKLWNTENPRQPEAKLNTNFPVWRARYTPFGHGLVSVVVPQLRRGENSICLWNTLDLSSPVPAPVHTFEGHSDLVLDFHWRSHLVEGEEQFQLITWSKDHNLRFWAVEPKVIAACSNLPSIDTDGMYSIPEKVSGSAEDIAASYEMLQEKRLSNAQPQTLQQEFALMNVNINNVTVEQMDAGQRCCTVTVTNGARVTLSIHFPSMYPNNAMPSFEFTPDTVLPLAAKSRLSRTLRETAQNHVKLNQTCLEPCLRQLVSQLEELRLQEERTVDVTQSMPQILPVTYGSYQDAAIPFPRTSGARFSACGLLVCFHRPNASNEPTPRSLSALSAYSYRPGSGPALPPLHNTTGGLMASQRHSRTFGSFGRQILGSHGRQGYFRSLSQEDRLGKKFGSVSSHGTRTPTGLVLIWDVSVLMPLHRALAQSYVLEGNDVKEICQKNQAAAQAVGRKDLVQTWSLLALVLERKLAQSPDNVDDTPWALHPFGRALLDSLMEYYLSIRDFQTLAMLSCVMSHQSLPDSFKPPRSQAHIVSSKSFTFGSTMHGSSPNYDSFRPAAKRSKSVANTTIAMLAESPPELLWNEFLMPSNESWTPPELISKRDAMEEQRKQHENNCRLLVQSKVSLHDHYKRLYADALYRWNLLAKRAEVLKYLSKPPEPHRGVEFITRCHNCLQRMRGAQCVSCKEVGLQCIICHVAVRGASNFCLACGHGGHTYHMMRWFESMEVCPTGCGCLCLKDGGFSQE